MHLVLAISPASCYPAGAADGSLKVWDKRKLGPDGGSALFTFNHHTGAVLRAEWSPSAPGELHMPTHQDLLCSPSLQQTWPHITCQHIKICLAARPCSKSCHYHMSMHLDLLGGPSLQQSWSHITCAHQQDCTTCLLFQGA